MSLVYVGFAPHPPIAIPEVARGQEKGCQATVSGMATLAQALCATNAEILLVVSPHAPYDPDNLTYIEGIGGKLEGDLSDFHAGDVHYSLETVPEILQSLGELDACGVRARLDHGVIVPLYFLAGAGWQGRLVVVSSPPASSEVTPDLWGKRIARILEDHPQRCALLASGDLSHKLKEEGPYGFHPAGPQFDELIVRGLRTEPEILAGLPEILVEEAAQCGYSALLLALGARRGSCRVFSYEGPFGVGYMTAEIYKSSPVAGYARACLCHYLEERPTEQVDVPVDPLIKTKKACFVTLYQEGELRGCIGTLSPVRPTLADEIRHNAVSAATQDPRFRSVQAEELSLITVSVDVLGDLEKVTDISVLDPQVYGVVVRSQGRVGLLLPHLSGVDSVNEQLTIARQKGGIPPDEEVEIWRFQVDRYYE